MGAINSGLLTFILADQGNEPIKRVVLWVETGEGQWEGWPGHHSLYARLFQHICTREDCLWVLQNCLSLGAIQSIRHDPLPMNTLLDKEQYLETTPSETLDHGQTRSVRSLKDR